MTQYTFDLAADWTCLGGCLPYLPSPPPVVSMTFNWPPKGPAGFATVEYAPCSNGMDGLRIRIKRTDLSSTYGAELLVVTASSIGPDSPPVGTYTVISVPVTPSTDQTHFLPFAMVPCDGGPGVRTKRIVVLREYCDGELVRKSSDLFPPGFLEPGGDPPPDYVVRVRETIRRAGPRGNFRVRSPSAVMGVRGLKDTVTTLKLARPDPAWTVRWRAFGDDATEDGTAIVRDVADGIQPGGSVISGASTPMLSITDADQQDLGSYFMELIPPEGQGGAPLMAGAIRLIEDLGQPVFSQEPLPRTLCPSQLEGGGIVEIPVLAQTTDQGSEVHYQWLVNGAPVNDTEAITFESQDPDTPPFTATLRVRGCWTSTLQLYDYTTTGTVRGTVTFNVQCQALGNHGAARSFTVPISIDHGTEDCDQDGTADACEIAAGGSDTNDNDIPDSCECLADLNFDGDADGMDLATLLANWGPVQPEGPSMLADINASGAVDGTDLAYLLGGWGPCQ